MDKSTVRSRAKLVWAIILIACCLRSPITGVGPLVSTIQGDLALGSTAAGLLTTIPLLAFAVASAVVGPLSARLGAGRTMTLSLALLVLGILCRSWCGTAGLFIGTVAVGAGIGINNVLLPGIVKSEFPDRIGPMTGLYSTFMAGFATVSGGVSVPIALAGGWRVSLCVWVLIALAALLVWLPSRSLRFVVPAVDGAPRRSVARDKLTWFIAVFTGLQAMMFYCLVAWFSSILQSKGYGVQTAGFYNGALMLVGVPCSFAIPVIAARSKRLPFWGVALSLLYAVCMVGTIFAEHPAGLWTAIVSGGLASGTGIAFAMTLFPLHTRDAQDAASLSGLAQAVGYLLAAVGPTAMGKLFDAAGWTLPLAILAVLAVVMAIFGYLVGKPHIINE